VTASTVAIGRPGSGGFNGNGGGPDGATGLAERIYPS
jgi:hypothetical protein